MKGTGYILRVANEKVGEKSENSATCLWDKYRGMYRCFFMRRPILFRDLGVNFLDLPRWSNVGQGPKKDSGCFEKVLTYFGACCTCGLFPNAAIKTRHARFVNGCPGRDLLDALVKLTFSPARPRHSRRQLFFREKVEFPAHGEEGASDACAAEGTAFPHRQLSLFTRTNESCNTSGKKGGS